MFLLVFKVPIQIQTVIIRIGRVMVVILVVVIERLCRDSVVITFKRDARICCCRCIDPIVTARISTSFDLIVEWIRSCWYHSSSC